MIKRLFFVFGLLFLLGCNVNSSVKELKLAHSLSNNHPVHKAMQYFAERVAFHSEGKMKIKIYSSSQLGSERECLELLQLGSLAMTKVSSAVMENFSPKLKVFGYPYLFESKEQRYALYDSDLGKELLADGEKYWLHGLTYFDAGSRSFYTKDTPITVPSDLKGLKVRVMQSPTAIKLVSALGGSPTPVSWGELYTSLQQGVVDAAENNLPSFYSSKHYEICKNLCLDEHSSLPDIVVMSSIIYSELSEEEKQVLSISAQEAALEQRKLWEIAEKESLEAVTEAGVKVTRPDIKVFKKESKQIITDLQSEDPDLYELIQEIKEIQP
ncbi:TRAP transporter substrate-binding protein [Zunongwangia endophytica]|uniref:TRAP transporter substrate-binding protein n=1 Tax=Zunongwangia endophytica TaxID=1808945 RepID=A0ABV8H2E3_9FLAO|nr:TRAP transporter substrate-binding protein [Zunongwangia endophytica]MDN3594452.1 TRAP transporter substrate-binding protein [Zunongwangia endophytica]